MEHKIQIMGFYSTINNVTELINKINALNGDSCTIQLLNADGIAGEEHILHATHQAKMAFNRKENIANDLGLEICVRASGQRQISNAIKILGLKEGLNNICVVIVGCNVDTMDKVGSLFDKRGDDLLNPDEKTLKKIYEISDKEMKSVGSIEKVMIERTTLLILETK
jgi:KEOPS complex subunit Cgi121